MKSRRDQKSPRGTVLILALWVLTLLTLFTVSIGVKVGQKIFLVSRLEKRAQAYYAAEAGIRKAIVLLKSQLSQDGRIAKTVLFDNPELFKAVTVGSSAFDVSYPSYDSKDPSVRVFGVIDEERKININTSDRGTLESLLYKVTGLSKEASEEMAGAIIDWREFGESETGGFFSDDYYGNLKFPYKEKKADFETMDELLLVGGMTPDVYQQVFPFITIYGGGTVNLNTAPKAVLMALGMSEALANKAIVLRRGPDGKEATEDDIIFPSSPEILDIFVDPIKAEPEEVEFVTNLFRRRLIGGESSHFMIRSRGYLNVGKEPSPRQENRSLTCVFNLNSGKINYWREN